MGMLTVLRRSDSPALQAEFLKLCPLVLRHARFVFRDRNAGDREEAEAEAIASAFESFLALKARGKDPIHDFPAAMATYAVLHVKDGRHVGGRSSRKDVLSRKAQVAHRFRVEPLPVSQRTSVADRYSSPHGQQAQDAFEERLQDNDRTPVAEQVCFRLDFPAFLGTLSARDRRLVRFLSLGHSAKHASDRFKLSPARITQLRKRWQRDWRVFQGDQLSAPEPEERHFSREYAQS